MRPEPLDGGVIAFAGPCLYGLDDSVRRHALRAVDLRPPVRRGDVIAAVADEPRTIVVLDGVFFGELSVAHQELLYALESGIRVVGAASMGALRAAEMRPFGMLGVGRIYRQFARRELDGDDEVALLHLDENDRYRPLTAALVEVRWALAALVEDGLSAGGARRVVAELERLPFSRRTPERIEQACRKHLGMDAARAVDAIRSCHLKERDAVEALDVARRQPPSRPRPAARRPVFVSYWCEEHVRLPRALRTPDREATLLRATAMVQLFHPGAAEFVEATRLRLLAASAAERAGLEPDGERVDTVQSRLLEAARRGWGGCPLAPVELRHEARTQALADAAAAEFGGPHRAADWLATEYGLAATSGHLELLRLLAIQYGLQPTWTLVRAIAQTPALAPALDVANAADRIFRSYREWASGHKISWLDLTEVAAAIWACEPEEVVERGRQRGLLEALGFSLGIREILERVAPAERLATPVNRYTELKVALSEASLEYPVRMLAPTTSGRPPRQVPKDRSSFPIRF